MEFRLPVEYLEMSNERKEKLKEWISRNFYARKTINKYHTSYGLKHLMQSDTGDYYTNDEFKGGMLDMGFIPDDACKLNWCFNVSEQSYKGICTRLKREGKIILA